MNMLLTTTKTSSTRPVTLPLHNLRCSSDAQTVERVLRREQGVATVYANPATEKVYIEYDAALTNRDRLRALLQEAGFGPKPAHVTCGHCR